MGLAVVVQALSVVAQHLNHPAFARLPLLAFTNHPVQLIAQGGQCADAVLYGVPVTAGDIISATMLFAHG